MEVSVLEAISRMLHIAVEEQGSTLYVQVGDGTEVILRGEESERRILKGPQRVFDQLRSRLLHMARLPAHDPSITREGEILYLVDGQMHTFLFRETRSLRDSRSRLLTLRCVTVE